MAVDMTRLQLPRLETEFECGDIGYPGIRVVYVLNPPRLVYTEPKNPKPEEEASVVALTNCLARVIIPGQHRVEDEKGRVTTYQYTDDGEDVVFEIDTPADLVKLVDRSGLEFDWAIIGHTSRRYWAERRERDGTARKN